MRKYKLPRRGMRIGTVLVIGTLFCGILAGCSNSPQINPEGPYWKDNDTKGIAEPPFEEPSLTWTATKRSSFDQALELVDLDRNVRKVSGRMTPAKNTNSFDEVPNSSWFTNRHGLPQTRLTPEEIMAGPNITGGPSADGKWTVFRAKTGGATVGFWIRDERGFEYLLKFDPPSNPEMSTSAAAMGSRFFYACGYNVSEETVVYFHPERLQIGQGVTYKDKGLDVPLDMSFINEILDEVHHEPDGSIRGVTSLSVGNVKGPFMYSKTRADDPNDWCPHEHRRELRGLYVLGSLINHYDLKDHNSMDVYVGEDGSGYLKHYLMDFASTFGSDGKDAKILVKGYANTWDVRDIGVSMITIGAKQWAWQSGKDENFPSVGYFESEIFQADKFDVVMPNPAFEQLTVQDGYWGAKIVMAFSEDDLKAMIASGQLSDPRAAAYLLKIVKERQEKIGRYWFSKVNPLDFPYLVDDGSAMTFSCRDLAIDYDLERTGLYQYELRHKGKIVSGPTDIAETEFRLSGSDLSAIKTLCADATGPEDKSSLIELRIRTQRDNTGLWSKDAIFWLYYRPASRKFAIAGIEHPG